MNELVDTQFSLHVYTESVTKYHLLRKYDVSEYEYDMSRYTRYL